MGCRFTQAGTPKLWWILTLLQIKCHKSKPKSTLYWSLFFCCNCFCAWLSLSSMVSSSPEIATPIPTSSLAIYQLALMPSSYTAPISCLSTPWFLFPSVFQSKSSSFLRATSSIKIDWCIAISVRKELMSNLHLWIRNSDKFSISSLIKLALSLWTSWSSK